VFVGGNAVFGEKSGGPQCEFIYVFESVLLFAAISLDTHRDAGRETLDRRVEKIEQVFVGVRTLFDGFQLFLKRR